MTVAVGTREMRARFSEFLERAERGETVVITRRGKEVARLTPPEAKPKRQGGWMKGKIWMAPDFDDTPEEIIELFEGRDSGW